MGSGHYVDEYRKNAVTGATPLQLVVMLYDGALRFMNSARTAMASRNLEEQNAQLQKAQRIVTELMSCLDMQQGKEIAQNLFAIYSYVYNLLVQANIEDRIDLVDQSFEIMAQLRESWAELDAQMRGTTSEPANAAA